MYGRPKSGHAIGQAELTKQQSDWLIPEASLRDAIATRIPASVPAWDVREIGSEFEAIGRYLTG
ncbi:hypothetical protein T265_04713 [Opisthorchis viverrini]|uniref:Uncharacterized protein n=1 Tax=Opisthorchis viverrini TaxID=6198 RepID=A0A074ZRN5_OPIVI|nr:hypothetical protein T265_04713 [Opisthorchis viverrini]KER28492.1 hypothetical protein T265_04713 [Opisthorchis viverrini]